MDNENKIMTEEGMSKPKSKTWSSWAIRKVRNGRVKFHGRWYYPYDKYNGEIDDRWIVFHSYDNYYEGTDEKFLPYICPWGTLEFYNAPYDSEEQDRCWEESPFKHDDWSQWFPDVETSKSLLEGVTDLSTRRQFEIDLRQVLYSGMDIDEFWKRLNWKYREIFPDYNRVWTHPEDYAFILEGAQ
ncbi:hypothetical protein LCGC14_1528420 [marine sediment metagenome]|uniref:Uncharacterized protein n=1 Tax=marine sediment metagenome TaxID=412755 RepID=A0A0F9JHH7_9ZZZZ